MNKKETDMDIVRLCRSTVLNKYTWIMKRDYFISVAIALFLNLTACVLIQIRAYKQVELL